MDKNIKPDISHLKKQLGCNDHMEKDKVDIAHLIRSMQRLEKGPDCFGMADIQDLCHDKSCMWRKLCLEYPRADRDGKNALNCRHI